MSIRVRVVPSPTGRKDFKGLHEEARQEWQPRAARAVTQSAQMLWHQITRSLARTAAQPSAPGMPPRRVTGDLLRSVKLGKTRVAKYRVTARIWTRHPGAEKLEYHGVHKRPFFRPAIEKLKGTISRILEAA